MAKGCERRLTEAINDAGFVEVVGRHLDFDAISDSQSDESLPHLAGNVSEHHVAVVQFDTEHSSRQDCFDFAFQFDVIFHPLFVKSVLLVTSYKGKSALFFEEIKLYLQEGLQVLF